MPIDTYDCHELKTEYPLKINKNMVELWLDKECPFLLK